MSSSHMLGEQLYSSHAYWNFVDLTQSSTLFPYGILSCYMLAIPSLHTSRNTYRYIKLLVLCRGPYKELTQGSESGEEHEQQRKV